jgi:hypothetical protein
MGLERGPLSLVSTVEELLGRKSSSSGLEIRECGSKDPSRWLRGTLYPQKMALTSPTSGGRSVSIVRTRIQATEFRGDSSYQRVTLLNEFPGIPAEVLTAVSSSSRGPELYLKEVLTAGWRLHTFSVAVLLTTRASLQATNVRTVVGLRFSYAPHSSTRCRKGNGGWTKNNREVKDTILFTEKMLAPYWYEFTY